MVQKTHRARSGISWFLWGCLSLTLVMASYSQVDAKQKKRKKSPETLVSNLPLAKQLLPELESESDKDLRKYRQAILMRLFLGEGRISVQTPQDIHDVIVLAALCERLSRPHKPHPDPRAEHLEALRAAYVIHAAGHTYEHDISLRAAVERLADQSSEKNTDASLFSSLKKSASKLEAVGRRWFPTTLHRALPETENPRELHHLRGLWLEREGRLKEAKKAMMTAIHLRATVPCTQDLIRLLISLGKQKDARHLAATLEKNAPASRGRINEFFALQKDRNETRKFERRRGVPPFASRIEQAWRYEKLSLSTKAAAILEGLRRDHGKRIEVQRLEAELWLRWRRFGRLSLLFEKLQDKGNMDAHFRLVRIGAVITARLAKLKGQSPHALAELDISEDFQVLQHEQIEATRLFLAEAKIVLAATNPKLVKEEILSLTSQAIRAFPQATGPVFVGTAALLTHGFFEDAVAVQQASLQNLDAQAQRSIELSLGGMEIAYGVSRKDDALLGRGLKRIRGLAPFMDPTTEAIRRLHDIIGGQVASWRKLSMVLQKAQQPISSDAEALKALLPLIDQIDPQTPMGDVAARAAAFASGALAWSTGQVELAQQAYKVVRRFQPKDALAAFSAGFIALWSEDASGADAAFAEASELSTSRVEQFMAIKWRALTANKSGVQGAGRPYLQQLLELWERTSISEIKNHSRPQPIVVGGVEIGVRLDANSPPVFDVALTPSLTFIADFPHRRSEIRAAILPVASVDTP